MGTVAFTANGLLRSLWPQKSIYEQMFEGSPALGIARKDTSFGEEYRYIIMGYGAGQGIASDYASAKQFRGASKTVKFGVQTRSYYATFSIEGKLWRAYRETGNKALIVDPTTRESKNHMAQVKNDLGVYIHGNGVGSIGRILSGSTTATITLDTTSDGGAAARRIQPGMAIQTESTGATGGTINTGYVTIASVGGTDTAPTVTCDQSAWNVGIPGIGATDYLYRFGTYDLAPLIGFDAWGPDWSAGSPAALLGATRSTYPRRLAGSVLDGTVMTPRQRALKAARYVAEMGGQADTYLTSTRNWENLANELQASNRLQFSKVPAAPVGKMSLGINYDSIQLMGPTGPMDVLADPWMPDNVERCIQRDCMVLASTGELLQWEPDASPGNPRLEDGADAHEVRLIGDMAFYLEAAAYQCRVKVTP